MQGRVSIGEVLSSCCYIVKLDNLRRERERERLWDQCEISDICLSTEVYYISLSAEGLI